MTFKELLKNNIFLKLVFLAFIILIFNISFNKPPTSDVIDNEYQNWTKYVYQNVEIANTEDWFTFISDNSFGKFSIGFPNDWKIDRNVIKDNKSQRIGEFSPGLVKLKPNQSCFDSPWHNETGQSEFISLNDIQVGSLKGKLLIEKAQGFTWSTDGDYIYPHFYCLSNGNNAFVIIFFEKTQKSDNEELNYKILSTLEI